MDKARNFWLIIQAICFLLSHSFFNLSHSTSDPTRPVGSEGWNEENYYLGHSQCQSEKDVTISVQESLLQILIHMFSKNGLMDAHWLEKSNDGLIYVFQRNCCHQQRKKETIVLTLASGWERNVLFMSLFLEWLGGHTEIWQRLWGILRTTFDIKN